MVTYNIMAKVRSNYDLRHRPNAPNYRREEADEGCLMTPRGRVTDRSNNPG